MKHNSPHHTPWLLEVCGLLLIIIGVIVLHSILISRSIQKTPTLLNFEVEGKPDSTEFIDTTSTVYRVIIPKIGVDMPVVIGETDEKKALDNGAWLIPGTAIPGANDPYHNTVLSAHRFKYTSGKYTFFEVDKLVEGDEIIITTDTQRLRYGVIGTEVVLPNAVRILEKTDTPLLTLFTCTPKFSSKYRLVIYAKPV